MHYTTTARVLLVAGIALGVMGCASAPVSHDFLDALVKENIMLAQRHLGTGETLEANQLIQAGAALNPSHPGVVSIQHEVASEDSTLVMPSALGVNRLKRTRTKPSILKRVVWYIPDRLLDILDVVGLNVHVGPGLFLNYHITRAVQLGGGARAVAGLGWHTKRSLGLRGEAEAGLTAIAAGAQTYNAGQVGTSGLQAGSFHQAGLHRPTDPVYQGNSGDSIQQCS